MPNNSAVYKVEGRLIAAVEKGVVRRGDLVGLIVWRCWQIKCVVSPTDDTDTQHSDVRNSDSKAYLYPHINLIDQFKML